MAILAQFPTCRTKQKVANKRCRCGEDLDKAKKANRVQYWASYYLPGGKNRREPAGISIDKARDAEGKRRAHQDEVHVGERADESEQDQKNHQHQRDHPRQNNSGIEPAAPNEQSISRHQDGMPRIAPTMSA